MTKRDKLRQWQIPESFQWHHLRYKSPYQKGVFWYYFSLFVRQRDVEKWGTCISCGCPITVESCDAGHFIPARGCGPDLLFDELNVNAECKKCNAFDELHLLGYAEGLDSRYGDGTSKSLRLRHQAYKDGPVLKDFTAAEYEAKINQLPNYKYASNPTSVQFSSSGMGIL